MYNKLIEIKKDGNVFLQDNSIALMPCLWKVYKNKQLGSNQVRYIISVYDYKSPYRKFPLEVRRKQVSYAIWSKDKNPKLSNQIILDAIDEYKRFQYDPLIDQYNAMLDQAYQMNIVYKEMKPTKENFDEMNSMQEKMFKAAKAREDIKQLIMKDKESESNIAGTDSSEFSLFEQDDRL